MPRDKAYEWKSVSRANGVPIRSLTYKGVDVGCVVQTSDKCFQAYKLGEHIGNYPSSIRAMAMVERPWVEM